MRGALGRDAATRGLSRPNISSCKFVVTLHGCVDTPQERRAFEEVMCRVPGVRGVVNKILIF